MAKLMLSWTKGKVGGGKRTSKLFRNRAAPPVGKPVRGSRGPAWLSPKPRWEAPPPMKKRSGRGIKVKPGGALSPGCVMMVLANGFSNPTRVERAKTNSRVDFRFPKG